jgi:chromosome segregation ATPase
MPELEERVATLETEMRGIPALIELGMRRLESQIAALHATVAQTRVDLQREIEASRIETIRAIVPRLDKVEQRLDKVEQRLDRVEQRLGAVELKLGGAG